MTPIPSSTTRKPTQTPSLMLSRTTTSTPVLTATISTEYPVVPAEILILTPGSGSKLVSPVELSARFNFVVKGHIRVELYGANNQLLYRSVQKVPAETSVPMELSDWIEFEIANETETGRLVISGMDEMGRAQAVNSVDLLLRSEGTSEVLPPGTLLQPIVIQSPKDGAVQKGGNVIVSGLAIPEVDRPLRIELIAEDGRVVGQRLAGVGEPSEGEYGIFTIEVPYRISDSIPVRLIVYRDGAPFSPYAQLASINLILDP